MLVNRVKDEIASELVHNLYAQITSLETLLRETDDVASRRRELVEQLAVLNRGISILNEIRDAGILAAPPTAGRDVGGVGEEAGARAGSEGAGARSGAGAGAPSAQAAPVYSFAQPVGSSPGPQEEEGRERSMGAGGLAKGGAAVSRRSLEARGGAASVPSQAPPRLGNSV